MSKEEKANSLEMIVVNALKVPGVKVNRQEFLTQILASKVSSSELLNALDKGPVDAGISVNLLNKLAKSHIEKRTLQSTGISFATGLPGGIAMAATIPADTLQFFGVALRLAQELAYLFGHEDLWGEQGINSDRVKSELIIFLGVMFGVGGASSALKIVSAKVAQQTLKKLPQRALMKTIYYPIVKKVAATIGVKITKKTFAQGISKAIPVLGGVISGGITYASMKPMGNRLRDELYKVACNYSEKDFVNDMENFKKEVIDIGSDEETEWTEVISAIQEEPAKKVESVADEILKFKNLVDLGVITDEEFQKKKNELLNM
ncbi:Short C-terminal domain-containing protein [Paenibacillus polysaccharolyticus]|uniref:Short C-terminal domain-containing protein n=1 Tax=Paenibacillus polysaccharolyticus TaxID=582692 RepID=A0A1G5JHT8_9BACL|nr:SHOCT domain-containing protein [Paenibacillus polysaccharolyticus]SCY87953.1 Short C-terminal domain-containing protein [Paenibacillus polysaccharolyticus]